MAAAVGWIIQRRRRTEMAIALVAAGVEPAVGDGVFDGAVGFVRVGAVGKAAEADVGADVAVEAGDFFGDDVPELELADAGRIDDEAADVPAESGGRRSSCASLSGSRSLTAPTRRASSGSMALSSDDLPTPLWPATTLSLLASRRRSRSMPWPVAARDEQHAVAHLAIDADQRHQIGRLDEVDLVDAQDRLDPHPLGFDQEAIDQVGLEIRLGGAGHDDELIDVGDQNLLPRFAAAAEDVLPRLDPLDERVACRLPGGDRRCRRRRRRAAGRCSCL